MLGAKCAAWGANARCGPRAVQARNAWCGMRAMRARNARRGVRAVRARNARRGMRAVRTRKIKLKIIYAQPLLSESSISIFFFLFVIIYNIFFNIIFMTCRIRVSGNMRCTARKTFVAYIRRHGSVSALKCMRDEMHRVPLREPASCEHP